MLCFREPLDSLNSTFKGLGQETSTSGLRFVYIVKNHIDVLQGVLLKRLRLRWQALFMQYAIFIMQTTFRSSEMVQTKGFLNDKWE